MIWLGIDTANTPLAIALVKDGQVIAEEVANIKLNHSGGAMPAIDRLFAHTKMKPSDLDAIAVSEGPGSYTGVRIGVTIAKTLAWTLNIPIVGVSSLKVLAANVPYFPHVICSLVDARRQNVYAGAYSSKDSLEVIIEDGHYELDQLLNQLDALNQPILFVGHDVEVFYEKIVECLGERALRAPYPFNLPSASQLIYLAEQQPLPAAETVHAFVPTYKRIAEAEANWIKEQKAKQHD